MQNKYKCKKKKKSFWNKQTKYNSKKIKLIKIWKIYFKSIRSDYF